MNVVSLNNSKGWSSNNNLWVDYVAMARYPIQAPVKSVQSAISSTVAKGTYITEVQQLWEQGYGQITRLYSDNNQNFLDAIIKTKFDFVEEINVIQLGRELVTRFTTGIDNSDLTLITDDNCILIYEQTIQLDKHRI